MTPVWVFPAYPLLLTAPFASNLIASAAEAGGEPEISSIAVAFSAISTQGAGFLISFMVLAAFVYRLMTQKLPRDMQRPGVVSSFPAPSCSSCCSSSFWTFSIFLSLSLSHVSDTSQFISIGPSGFTVAGIVTLGQYASYILPPNFQGEEHSVFIIQILSTMIGLWLWGLSVWFFVVSVGSLWKYVLPGHHMPFQMTWWSFVFPNTALITATMALGTSLNSDGLKIFGCVLAACLVVVWIAIFATMLKCLWKKQLLWPKELSGR